ncbi:hypothetical protein LJC06_03910 [Bacteroidales bacterium OttesenSCG-928-I14]|nr:hypothetical protein [Bacteroidales bacterium OttesenSCG-928-I14]
MGNEARNYTLPTLKRLYGLSGNQCAASDCKKKLIARDGISIISKICHIEAASKDGPRYNPSMTDKERAHFDNLILLCDECHTIIDNKMNEDKYPVSLLKEWKKNHESRYLHEKLRNTSLLMQAINIIADADFANINIDAYSLQSFDISSKIKHNNIKRNKFLIDEYSGYYAKINSLYSELEEQGDGFKKEKLLRNIRTIYLKVKGRYANDALDPITIVQENADDIFEEVECELLSLVKLDNENSFFSISIIMVDAFMRCKILEEPMG